jgi:hypothetical protein
MSLWPWASSSQKQKIDNQNENDKGVGDLAFKALDLRRAS